MKNTQIQETSDENSITFDTLIAGGGIAGLITALTLLEQDQSVCIIDRDTPERLGGLARWAFGGMALSGTKQQRKSNIPDNSERLLRDWYHFAEFNEHDYWPKQWAKEYAQHNNNKIYHYLLDLGLKFLPVVNWVERGMFGEGNSLPRYHVLWGTGWHLVETIINKLQPFIQQNKLIIYHQHKVSAIDFSEKAAIGAQVENELTGVCFSISANNVVIACGGINGSAERVKQNWTKSWGKPPSSMLNGANPISDGKLHDHIEAHGGKLTNLDNMWNYAAGIKHPQPEFNGHGLSLIPCKSALWLDHSGKRIGPIPLITGFDTNYLCQQVARQEKPWTWQVLNWRIAAKELAISGSLHNPSIRDRNFFRLLKELVFGNQKLLQQLEHESDDFIVADNLEDLVKKMNLKTEQPYINYQTIKQQIKLYDERVKSGEALQNDEQVRRINHARQWQADKLRTCKPAPILSSTKGKGKKAEKLIAIKLQLISRKSLGGLQTNLASQVLDQQGNVMKSLYCVGEAAGFGGGGASGKRSLEGTFLSSCILTARNAAEAIIKQSK